LPIGRSGYRHVRPPGRITLLDSAEEFLLHELFQYGVSYQPVQTPKAAKILIWHEPVSLGHPLPELPLPLDKGQSVPLDLEVTYEQACQRMRLP
jgi:hypothetical protein